MNQHDEMTGKTFQVTEFWFGSTALQYQGVQQRGCHWAGHGTLWMKAEESQRQRDALNPCLPSALMFWSAKG